jgi:hypothetical protein
MKCKLTEGEINYEVRGSGRPLLTPDVSHKNKGGVKLKLNVKAFALTCGIIWGFGLFLLTWWIILFEGATGEPTLIGLVYRGFTISPAGSIIGFFWALVDGLIGGAILAWLYNLISARILSSES